MTKIDLADVLRFPKNEHGHPYVNIIGLTLGGVDEIYNLENQGHQLSDPVRTLLLLQGNTSYNFQHRLKEKRIYQVALVLSTEVASFIRDLHPDWDELKLREMTNEVFLKYGARFGYSRSLAGLHLRLHKIIKPEHLAALNLHHMTSLHEPIMGLEGHPWMLCSRLYRPDDTSLTLTLKSGSPHEESHDAGILAYLMPSQG